ncbi:MAG: multidrug transporter permease [Herbaspirillum sp.]|jgi:drug/metabolite transporter (DMT)-like permease|nr:multidrug transporter permease [Herbaspirillum sp.]
MRNVPLPAAAALMTNALIWGLSWTAFKFLQANGMHPLWSTACIFCVCLAVLIALRPAALQELRGHPELILVGVTSGLTNAGFNVAVGFGDVVRVLLLFYLMPVWSVVLARVVLHEAIRLRAVMRIALGLAGAMVVLYQPGMGMPLPHNVADWTAVSAGFAFALNNVLLRRHQEVSGAARGIAMLSGCTLLSAGFGAVFAGLGAMPWPPALNMTLAPTLAAWSALFLAAMLCLQYGVVRLPANITSVIMLAEILFASVSAWALGATVIHPSDLIGGALIISAPWLIRDRAELAGH